MENITVKEQLAQLQEMEKHMNRLSNELESLEQKSSELQMIQEALSDLKDKKEGTELLVPISNGIFIKAKLVDAKQLLVNVGSGTVIPKSNDEAKKMVEKQQAELDSYKANIISQMQAIDERAYELEAGLQTNSNQ